MLKQGFISVSLRVLTLASKFVLLMYLVRYFAVEAVGVYGLIAVTISISLYFLGVDFYVFSTREVLSQSSKRLPVLVRDQAVLHGIAYVIVLPILLCVFAANLIGWTYAIWFYGILVLEHLSQESYRLLVAISRPARANLILFLRSGAWIYAVVGLGMVSSDFRILSVVWVGWLTGALASIIIAAYSLRDYPWKFALSENVDWSWIRSGIKVAIPYLVASLCLMSVQFADRYAISYFKGEAQLGIYTFYAQIANTVQLLITTGVTSLIYPKMVSAYQKWDHDTFAALFKKLTWGVIAGTITLCLIISAAIPFVLRVLDRPHVAEYQPVLWLLLIGNGLLTLSHIPHYSLYAQGKDRSVVYSTVIACLFSVGLNCLLVPIYGLYGAALGTGIGSGSLLVCKYIMHSVSMRQLHKRRMVPNFSGSPVNATLR